MSLFSTITHPKAPQARALSLEGVGMLAVGLVLGATIALVITDSPRAADPSDVATPFLIGLTHDEFIRLNTSAIEYRIASPTVPQPSVEPVGGQQPEGATEEFLHWNIYSLEYSVAQPTDSPSGPK